MNFKNKALNALLIESNDTMRSIMLSMLRSMGFNNITSVRNEVNSFNVVVTQKIDLIVCSWDPLKFNALSFLKKIRSESKTSTIPFIIVSTIIEQDKIQEAVECGVSEYLVPPFNLLTFRSRVARAILTSSRKLTAIGSEDKKQQLISQENQSHLLKRHTSPLSVLIVDDVVGNIELIKEVIHDKYTVKATTNAKSAMKACLSEHAPDIVLLDIMMPEIDGLTLCKQLKENPITQNIVIIFLTALSEDKDIAKGLSLGAVDYITKPITPIILLARLQVHAKLILSQRAVQTQIDNLIKQNLVNDNFSQIFQKKTLDFIERGNTATQKLINHFNTQSRVCDEIKEPLSDLKVNLIKGSIFLNNISLLDKLKNQQYHVNNNSRTSLKQTLTDVIEKFSQIHLDKGLKSTVKIEEDITLSYDNELLDSLFSILYYKAVEGAVDQGVVALRAEQRQRFVLVTIHFEHEMLKDVVNYIESFDLDTSFKANYNLWIYLTLYIVETIKSDFYYHTSERYGTSFYLKLPLQHNE